jgi:hypothetical protein
VDAERTIREAIAARTPLALEYEGDRGPVRTVHPQVLFRTSPGELCVDCHQVSGYSSSGGPLPGWRDFAVAKIARVEVIGGSFGPAPGLNLAAPKYADVLAHV